MSHSLTLKNVWDINAAAEACMVNFAHGTGVFKLARISPDLFKEFVQAAKQDLTGKSICTKHLLYLDMAQARVADSDGNQKVNQEECMAVMMCAGGLEARVNSIYPGTLVIDADPTAP